METKMKTSAEWWAETKADPDKLADWLQRQFRGELTAADRILTLASYTEATPKQKLLLLRVASDENQHALWILDLLEARQIPMIGGAEAEKRYWAATLPGIKDFATGAAVGAHAERMRLERIRVIANDEEAPEDIRVVFTKILKDEEFHEKAFLSLTNEDALSETMGNHELGLQALGLVH